MLLTFADFFAIYGHVFRRLNPNSYLGAFDTQHGNRDVFAYLDRFVNTSCQNQHGPILLVDGRDTVSDQTTADKGKFQSKFTDLRRNV